MALLGMPVLLLNMGGEMVYILEQRLQAQAINTDKSKRVLQDVIRTMFNAKFIEELMKPQDLYSVSSLRGIFDRLAHSSIMRLSESSMDKLFDLMTMGVKYQVVCSTYPSELVDVTLNHLDSMRAMVEDQQIDQMVISLSDMFKKRYENLSFGEFMELKQTLHSFFQDRRIKVSLFLQEGLQTQTGQMVFPPSSCEYFPPGVVAPNFIKFYSSGGEVKTKTLPAPSVSSSTTTKVRSGPVRSKLGLNLYLKSKPSGQTSQPTQAPPATPPTPSTPTAATPSPPPPIPTKETEAPDAKPTSRLGAAELNILAQLISPPPSSDPSIALGDKEAVRINLFATDNLGQFEVSNMSSTVVVLQPTHEKSAYLSNLMSTLDIQSSSEGQQDLLDLMDSAG